MKWHPDELDDLDDDDDDDKYGTARKMASQLAVLNLSGSSGSNNQEDSHLNMHRNDAEFDHLSNHNQGHFHKLEGLQKRKERVFKQTSGSKREDNAIAHGLAA